jgi:hypothetical protein
VSLSLLRLELDPDPFRVYQGWDTQLHEAADQLALTGNDDDDDDNDD